MTKIKDMKTLRERMVRVFEDLDECKIDINQALALAKISDSIVNGLKTEVQYAMATDSQPNIPFLESEGKLINMDKIKKLI